MRILYTIHDRVCVLLHFLRKGIIHLFSLA
jgi:hypothetical protein